MTQVDILRQDLNALRREVLQLADAVRELDYRLAQRSKNQIRISLPRDLVLEPILRGRDAIHYQGEAQVLDGAVEVGEALGVHESSSRVGDEAATSSSHGTVGEPSDEAGGVVSSPPPASSGQGHTTPRVDVVWPNDDVRGL